MFLAHTITVVRQRALLISHSGSQADEADTLSNTASHSDRGKENAGGPSPANKVLAFKPKSSALPDTHTQSTLLLGKFPHEITLTILIRTFHPPSLFQVHKCLQLWPLRQRILFQEMLELQQPAFQLGGYSPSECVLPAHTIPA